MFNDITTGKVGRCKINVQVKREKWRLTKQDSDLVIGVSVVQDRKRLGHFRTPEPTEQELVMRASQEAVLSKQWGWVKSSKQDRDALLKENVFDWLARNLQNPPTVRSEGHKIGLALDTDVSEEQCPMCTEI